MEDGTNKVSLNAVEFHTNRAVIETNKPILYLHINFQAGINIVQPVISDHNFMAYIIEGVMDCSEKKMKPNRRPRKNNWRCMPETVMRFV